MKELYIGLMSGTSNDGIDACLVDLDNDQFKLIATLYQAYDDKIKTRLENLTQQQNISLAELSALEHELAVLNTLAVNKLLQNAAEQKTNIRAIGYHGQTVFHNPETNVANSLQLGDASFLAARTQICVVADLRRMDMAVGGQGAPLAPAFHEYVFRKATVNRAIVNIGGIANLTLMPANPKLPISGFDTGPGNGLMNEWIRKHKQQPFDNKGEWAAQGQCDTKLLDEFLSEPYFSATPPKSTGREYFNLNWIQEYTSRQNVSAQNVQTTLAHLTSQSIGRALVQFAPHTQELFVCGGGAHNAYLMSLLSDTLPKIKIASSMSLGLDPEWVEACAFAWMAKQRLAEKPANIPSVTGATKAVLLGGVYKP